jgi:mRNA-degrading endonuclease toxin of MazEF toxin-antitoxin module
MKRGAVVVVAVSQVMIDKIVSVPRSAINAEIGECTAPELDAVNDAVRRWLGLVPWNP